MNPQTINLLLYLLFWAVFCLGIFLFFRLIAAAVSTLDRELPGGCPLSLRRLTWVLSIVWSAGMFSEGIRLSTPYITAAL
ncbi:hypothetical protein VU08_09155 [Desulfobulbus sp. F5]|nr:hypothetical protein [Desulfobulbus sp. F5]